MDRDLADYLDYVSPTKNRDLTGARASFGGARRGFGAELVPTGSQTVMTTLAPTKLIYSGSATPMTTAPLAPAGADWRRALSLSMLGAANAIAAVVRSYPLSPIGPMATAMRTFALRVLDPNVLSIETARSALVAMQTVAVAAGSAGGAAEARAALARLVAMIPTTTSGGTTMPSTGDFRPGGGGGMTSDGAPPSTTSPGGGGSSGGGTAPTCEGAFPGSVYDAAAGGCVCPPGTVSNAGGTACVAAPADGGGGMPSDSSGSTTTATTDSSWMGWGLLALGAAVAYKALR